MSAPRVRLSQQGQAAVAAVIFGFAGLASLIALSAPSGPYDRVLVVLLAVPFVAVYVWRAHPVVGRSAPRHRKDPHLVLAWNPGLDGIRSLFATEPSPADVVALLEILELADSVGTVTVDERAIGQLHHGQALPRLTGPVAAVFAAPVQVQLGVTHLDSGEKHVVALLRRGDAGPVTVTWSISRDGRRWTYRIDPAQASVS